MDLKAIADELVAGCNENRESENLDKLYSADAVSVEAFAMPGGDGSRESVGLDAIKGKHAWWNENMEFLEGSIEGPHLHGDDRFALVFKGKIREKASGTVSDMNEVAIYHIADGKIVREEFFYTM